MNNNTFLFNATSLKKSEINQYHNNDLKKFFFELSENIGQIMSAKLRLCRIPADETMYTQYALIALEGSKSSTLIEITCSPKLNKVNWPQFADMKTGKRLCIGVVDWIDAFLLIKHLIDFTEV